MCDPFGDREIGLDYPQVCDPRLPMYDPFGVSHCLCASTDGVSHCLCASTDVLSPDPLAPIIVGFIYFLYDTFYI